MNGLCADRQVIRFENLFTKAVPRWQFTRADFMVVIVCQLLYLLITVEVAVPVLLADAFLQQLPGFVG